MMTDFPNLYALVVRLRPPQGAAPPTPGNRIQALFLDLVRQVDPHLSAQLHADAIGKPFTVAVLPADGRRQTTLDLRVTLLHADLFAPFSRALLQQTAQNTTMRLGQTTLVLTDVLGTPGSHPWAGYERATDLVDAVQPQRDVTLRFVTPTAFTQGSLGKGNRKRIGLLPLPDTVFSSLARRWNEVVPQRLHVDREQVKAACDETLVSRYKLETEMSNIATGVQLGFVGQCSYQLPDQPDQARLLTLLADAAFYLGVGTKTTRGMGLCRRVR